MEEFINKRIKQLELDRTAIYQSGSTAHVIQHHAYHLVDIDARLAELRMLKTKLKE